MTQKQGIYATCLKTWIGNDDFLFAIGLQKMRKKYKNR